jgi:hypothetical protein
MATATVIEWSTLQGWIQSNPFHTKTLPHYKPTNQSAEGTAEIPQSNGWNKMPVFPATPLSAVLLSQDALYNATYESTRRSLLRDETTDLQEKAIVHLKGRAWPVRRTAEGLAAVGLEEGRASTWSSLGWNALATLRECQFVVLNETKQTIQFYPEDVRTWSHSIDTIFIEYECRYTWSNPGMSIYTMMKEKVLDQEANGWTIEWPLADGSMEELRASTEDLQLNSAGKKKETLRSLVGRGQSIRHFVRTFQ